MRSPWRSRHWLLCEIPPPVLLSQRRAFPGFGWCPRTSGSLTPNLSRWLSSPHPTPKINDEATPSEVRRFLLKDPDEGLAGGCIARRRPSPTELCKARRQGAGVLGQGTAAEGRELQDRVHPSCAEAKRRHLPFTTIFDFDLVQSTTLIATTTPVSLTPYAIMNTGIVPGHPGKAPNGNDASCGKPLTPFRCNK